MRRAGGEGARNEAADDVIDIAGVALIADAAGALYWAEQRLPVVADLHLEKGSSYAARGMLLPPYDTAATLGALAALLERYRPQVLVALGDSFHDGDGPARLADHDRAALKRLQEGCDWIWIAGNHDPDPREGIGGSFATTLAIGALMFRHEPRADAQDGEIAGHLHPVARVSTRGRSVRRRCFAADSRRVVMPALGAYAGGLNVRDVAFAGLFRDTGFIAHMLGDERVHSFPAMRCLLD